MAINTCSGAISLSRELEEASARFYQELAAKFEKDKDFFLALAKENEKYTKQIERAYYSVITDAIEGCFAFNLEEEKFKLKPLAATGYADAVSQALEMEEKILKFYEVAAEQSVHLMADVPRSFTLVGKKRKERIPKLRALLEK